MTRPEFFKKYLKDAKTAANGTKIFPAVVLSVAALESNNGNSKLTREANNFFGFKVGSNWQGEAYLIKTREVIDGKEKFENAYFRKYDLPIDSFSDYVRLITTAPRYSRALDAKNAIDQIEAIKEAGYATDPKYVQLVAAVMDQLKSWVDTVKKKAPSELLGEQYYCFWGIDISLR